jgi:hypothetical protein
VFRVAQATGANRQHHLPCRDHERQRITRLDLERPTKLTQRAPSPIVAGEDRRAPFAR